MAPNFNSDVPDYISTEERFEKLIAPQARPKKFQISYLNIVCFTYWHIAGLYGLYLCITCAKWPTILQACLLVLAGDLGASAGAHRLWSHRSYKAKLPLQIILMMFQTITFQNKVFTWVRDHRMHHRYTDTDADPHNSSRGLFFSHVGWLLVKKDPEIIKRGKYIDMSDIYNNPVLKFQNKYAPLLIPIVVFILPTVIPMYFWDEKFNVAWHVTVLRLIVNLNVTFLVNSFAHAWGFRRYDKNIMPTQNFLVSLLTLGEGFHNYHHVFPWDYRSAELGHNCLNFTKMFIDFFAWIGWAYDLKTVSEDVIKNRIETTGDGTNIWGLLDSNIKKEGAKC